MGYTTEFDGEFHFTPPLDKKTITFLQKLNETRRMKRNFTKKSDIAKYGVEGEFFVDGKGDFGQEDDASVVDHNTPPVTQPGLWCQWRPSDDGCDLGWDGGEKFYHYVEWLRYIVDRVTAPKGHKLNGSVRFRGEDMDDFGTITVVDNEVTMTQGSF